MVAASGELSEIERLASRPWSFSSFVRGFCFLQLSPLMQAIVDSSESRPLSFDADACRRHFGCAPDGMPREVRRTIVVRAGGRGGKSSRLMAPKALHAAWTVPLPTLNPGESAVSLIVAPDMKLGRQTLSFVKGYVEANPVLRASLVGEPTVDRVILRRPDGKRVSIEVLAASAGGRAVRARTLVFAGLDEAAFFRAEGGAVNDLDIFNAVDQRLVPGAQAWLVSTPWIAGVGLVEKMLAEDWGRHERYLCVTGGTRALNPTWDPDGSIEASMRARDPDAARREIDGEPLQGGLVKFFAPSDVDAAVDNSIVLPRVPKPGEFCAAGGDFGFRRNSSALVITHMARDGRVITVGDVLELRPGDTPLKPSQTVGAFADRIERHAGLRTVMADDHYRESISEHLSERDLTFKPAPAGVSGIADTYMRARTLLREHRVRIPRHERLIHQLKAVEWRANVGGSVTILLPQDRDGSHGDLVSALVLALWELGGIEVPEELPKPGTPEYYVCMGERLMAEAMRDEDEPTWRPV